MTLKSLLTVTWYSPLDVITWATYEPSGGKITDVQAVQLPETDPRSAQISSFAAPQLRQSVLSAQSANIDAVSGATYTSDGYKQALQSALDRAGFSSASPASAG